MGGREVGGGRTHRFLVSVEELEMALTMASLAAQRPAKDAAGSAAARQYTWRGRVLRAVNRQWRAIKGKH